MREILKSIAETLLYFFIAYSTGLTVAKVCDWAFELDDIEIRNIAASYIIPAAMWLLPTVFPVSWFAFAAARVAGPAFIITQTLIYLIKDPDENSNMICGVFWLSYILFTLLMTVQLFKPSIG
ncbi:MAG: hypothetical protein FWF35_04940 [Elusimicrobia bacterium]|nr:hypothetical protein [Elusimicrobiota bacterium]